MTNGVVKVGRRAYAVGLFWQPSPSGRVAQAAREAALQQAQQGQKTDFYCVRAASKSVAVPQYGLGQSHLGHKAGMPTLAASLANVQPGSWAGAFRMREGTWVIVVRDDLVAPDGDMLFDSDEAARERLLQEISLGGVLRTYAPDGWSIPGSDPTPLPLLLQDRMDCRLQPVSIPLKLVMYGGVGAVVLVALVFMLLQYQSALQQEEMERLAKEKAKVQGAISHMVEEWQWPPAEQVYERVWEKKATVASSLDTCKRLFGNMSATQYGWKHARSTCVDNGLTIVWNHTAAKRGVLPDKAALNDTGTVATQTLQDIKLSPRGGEELYNEKETMGNILTRSWPVTLTRLPDDKPIVKPPEKVKKPPPPPPPLWRKRGVHYVGKFPPWDLRGLFETMPGLFVEKINWDGRNWVMEAVLYEKKGG